MRRELLELCRRFSGIKEKKRPRNERKREKAFATISFFCKKVSMLRRGEDHRGPERVKGRKGRGDRRKKKKLD